MLMMSRLLLLLLALVLTTTHAFVVTGPRSISAITTALSVSMQLPDEVAYRYYLAKARECAFSATASVSDAQLYLQRILELESGCISGNLAGHDLCDGVDDVAEVVSLLRRKSSETTVAVATTSSSSLAAVAIVPLSLLALLMTLMVVSTIDWQRGTVPFTFEEWVWATKGGYLHTMMDHYIRNGGL